MKIRFLLIPFLLISFLKTVNAQTDTVIVSDNNEYGFLKLYLNYTCDIISKETALENSQI